VIILVDLDVGEDSGKGEVAAIYHYILQNNGITALSWYAVWWEVLYLIQGP
jgi:hypothetical protein